MTQIAFSYFPLAGWRCRMVQRSFCSACYSIFHSFLSLSPWHPIHHPWASLQPYPSSTGPGAAKRERLWWTSEHTEHTWVLPGLHWKLGPSPRRWTEGGTKVSETSFFIFLCGVPSQRSALCLLAGCSSLLPLLVVSSCRGHKTFQWVHGGNDICVPCHWGLQAFRLFLLSDSSCSDGQRSRVRWECMCSSALET